MLNPGVRLQGRYDILQFIGQGGMAAVYLGADIRLGNRYVAVKQMDPTNLPQTEQQWAVNAFQQEAQVLAQMNHPAIARVIDFFQEGRFWYLIMEYVEGETLDAALNRFPRGFEERQVLLWAAQLGSALDYLHQQNPPIIFRDLKPANVMVQPNGVLKLIDFGIARYFKPDQNHDTVRLGTPGYAAPEQYGRGQTDARSDVFSMGVLLHQLLTGYDPGLSPMNLPAIRSMRPDISYRTAQAVEQALRVDPGQRFASMQHFAAALGVAISGALPPISGEITSSPITAASNWLTRQQPTVWVGIGAAAVILLFLFGSIFASRRDNGNLVAATPLPEFIVMEITQVVTPTPETDVVRTVSSVTEITQEEVLPTATLTETSTNAPPQQPTVTSIPTASATPPPTFTATPPPPPTFTATPPPPVCSYAAATAFSGTYQSYRNQLGCPTSNAWTTWSAISSFQRGRMFWRQDNGRIYVIYNNGGWGSYADTWSEGRDPEYGCGSPQQTPPIPKRGFGKVWCTQTGVQQGIGNATSNEWGEDSSMQAFANGFIWQNSTGRYILFNDGSWRFP